MLCFVLEVVGRVSEDLYYYSFQFVASLNLVCDGGYFIML